MFTVDFEKLSEEAQDNRFCVICLRVRTDVPVEDNCCYECGGGIIPKNQLQ